jgi:hypothetical protein
VESLRIHLAVHESAMALLDLHPTVEELGKLVEAALQMPERVR